MPSVSSSLYEYQFSTAFTQSRYLHAVCSTLLLAFAHPILRNLRQNLQWGQGVLQQSFYDEV